VLFFSVVVYSSNLFAQAPYAAWSSIQRVIINTTSNGANVPATATAIPILVRLHPGNFSDFAKTQPKGADIRFSKPDGTPLPYQIDRWIDGTSNNDTAEIWVRLDTVLGNNSTQYFQMHYGNASAADASSGPAVFDSTSGFIGAWHCGETPDTSKSGILNAARNAFHGKPQGSMNASSSVAGTVGKAMQFNGSSDFVTFGDINAIDSVNKLTVGIWFKATQLRDWGSMITKAESNANGWFLISNGGAYQGTDDLLLAIRNQGSGTSQDASTTSNPVPTAQWVHCVMVYDGTQTTDSARLRCYVNGVEQRLLFRPTIPSMLPATAAHVQMGRSYFENYYFYGALDEPVIIRNIRSAAWVKLYYETQKPGSNCYTFQTLNLPTILAQTPARDTLINQGLPLTFSVTTSSASAVSYAWYKNGAALTGRTTASFTVSSIQPADSGAYYCRVTNTDGSVQSISVKVSVTPTPIAPVITVQPIDTIAVATTQAWLRLTATGATSYAWYRLVNGTGSAVTGGTAARLSWTAVRFADSGRYYCLVSNATGTTVSDTVTLAVRSGAPTIAQAGQPADLQVLEGIPWSMSVTAAGEPPLAYQWYKENVSPADSVAGQHTSTISFPIARISDAGRYLCVVSNAFGACTSRAALLSVEPNTYQITNPIMLSAQLVDSTRVSLRVSRFMTLPLTPPDQSFPWAADTVLVWYRKNQVPDATNLNDPNLIKFPLPRLIATAKDYYDSTVAVAKIGCQDYYFMGSVHWLSATLKDDSIPPLGDYHSAASVRMCDTTRITNPLKFSFVVNQPTDSTVAVTLSGLTGLASQMQLIASLVVRYSVASGSFIDSTMPKSMFSGAGNTITIRVRDSRFAGEEGWSRWQAFFKGINNNASDTVRDSCKIGTPKPINKVKLAVDTVFATQANLSWTTSGESYDRFRIWHGTSPVPDSVFSLGQYSADTFPGTALSGSIKGLEQKTTYYCGLQAERSGLWSLVTPAARCTFSTNPILDSAPIANTSVIDTISFDSVKNTVRIIWHVDTTLGFSVNAGITWHGEGGVFPVPGVQTTRFNTRLGGQPDTMMITVDGTALDFGQRYYFGVWLQKNQGFWSTPVAASTRAFTIPQPSIVRRVLFPNDVSIVSVFGGVIIFRKVDDMSREVLVRKVETPLAGAGLIKVSSLSIAFDPGTSSSIAIKIGMRYEIDSIPGKYKSTDIRMYRYDATRKVWLVDTTSLMSDPSGAPILLMNTRLDAAKYPYMLAIDTVRPVIEISGDTSSAVAPQQKIAMSVRVIDNIANPSVILRAGQGNVLYTQNDTIMSMEPVGKTDWAVRAEEVQGECGIRAVFLATDFHFTETADVSRSIRINKSDILSPEEERWTPLGATALLDEPGVKHALDEFGMLEDNWKYDNHKMRLFRFLNDRWKEFSEAAIDTFSFYPGRVIWLKARNPGKIEFGSGKSVSLKTPFTIKVGAKSWTDFCLPYLFDICIGDILNALSTQSAASLQFYYWKNGAGVKGGYVAKEFYLPLNDKFNDRTRVMRHLDSSGNKMAFTVYNPLDSGVDLRIPSIPLAMSSVTAATPKQTAATDGWSIVIRGSVEGETLSPVFCAYNRAAGRRVTTPTPPSWGNLWMGLDDPYTSGMVGNLVLDKMPADGFSCRLVFDNGYAETRMVTCAADMFSGQKIGFAIIDPVTGVVSENPAALSVEVPANGRAYRILAVGTPSYFANILKKVKGGEFALTRIAPNPFRGVIHIEFMVPYTGIEQVRCDMIDQRGRMVLSLYAPQRAFPGLNRVTWTANDHKRLAAGTYFIRLAGYDGKGKKIGEKFSKAMYLP
jgi:hypothetical protein